MNWDKYITAQFLKWFLPELKRCFVNFFTVCYSAKLYPHPFNKLASGPIVIKVKSVSHKPWSPGKTQNYAICNPLHSSHVLYNCTEYRKNYCNNFTKHKTLSHHIQNLQSSVLVHEFVTAINIRMNDTTMISKIKLLHPSITWCIEMWRVYLTLVISKYNTEWKLLIQVNYNIFHTSPYSYIFEAPLLSP